MPLSLEIKNLDKVLSEIKSYPADIEKIINNEFKVFGQGTVNDAKRLAPVNEGRLRESIATFPENLKVTISVNVDYAAYLEFGTKSFAASYVATLPPDWQSFAAEFKGGSPGSFKELVMRIKEWVRLKGFASGKDIDQAAYLIAVKIVRNGIRPHPYLYPSFMKNKIELIRNLKAQLNAK